MNYLDHNESWTDGVRVLHLTGRNKDGASKRLIHRVSSGPEKFIELMNELVSLARPGERIYASASARDVRKASVLLKHRMVDNDLHQNPTEFYEHLTSRWVSCLMDPTCQSPKKWMFDCDDPGDFAKVMDEVRRLELKVYYYNTKNGIHVMVHPFNKQLIKEVGVTTLIHDNPLMLWAY